jgi:hypothetical protein
MAPPKTARFGKFRIMLGDNADPIQYTAPCGFTSKSMTLTKNAEDVQLPDCNDPDAVSWLGRDATSLSMSISGEGVAAEESVEAWLDAWESVESVPVKVEIEFPAKTITWTGFMHVTTVTPDAAQGGRVTMAIEMASDGEMARTVTPVTP